MLTESLEDYLESVLILKYSKNTVRIKDIVEYLGVKNSSVVNAMKILKKEGYVDYVKYSHIDLTETGLTKASLLYSKHRAISRFFCEVLLISEDKSRKMACDIEHHMEIGQVKKLNCLTSYIVSKGLEKEITCSNLRRTVSKAVFRPLVLLKEGDEGVFLKYTEASVADRLSWIGFIPGTPFSVSRISRDHSIMEICHSGGFHSLSRDDAEQILVGEGR